MGHSFTCGNAKVITRDQEIDGGIVIKDGLIAEVFAGPAGRIDVDFAGDFLIPGLVELHTDNLERQFQPRPKVQWPADAAMLAHDTQMITAGITTVCDAVCVGFYGETKERVQFLKKSLDALAHAEEAGVLKSEHFLHLRCEVSDPHCADIFAPLADEPHLKVVSLMDHTPGQRQWLDIDRYRTFHRGRTGASEDEFQALIERRRADQVRYADQHRNSVLAMVEGRKLAIASHDDTTDEHVAEAAAVGATISEFPTTIAAARAAHTANMTTIMGAPNVILGGSHSGNVAAKELAANDLLDGLSSDYVPVSLLHAAFKLADQLERPLPEMIRKVSLNNAAMINMADRGEIAVGKRADIVRVRRNRKTQELVDVPSIIGVWRCGQRVA